LIKDAQRHGLRVKPVDVTRSEWQCTLEAIGDRDFALRLGLRYVRGLRQSVAQALVEERERGAFCSISDLAARVPRLSKSDFAMLAKIGALNHVGGTELSCAKSPTSLHRRDALWQSQKAAQRPGPLLREIPEQDAPSPLAPMNHEERLLADYHGTGMTAGPHPMFYRRKELARRGILSAAGLRQIRDGQPVRAAGLVITRQRPGTAKGLIFLSLEDETGIANVIIQPELYAQDPLMVIHEKFVLVEGRVQNHDKVVHVQAERIMPLRQELETGSLEPLGVTVEFG
jgi:error-prone DNA polymerase